MKALARARSAVVGVADVATVMTSDVRRDLVGFVQQGVTAGQIGDPQRSMCGTEEPVPAIVADSAPSECVVLFNTELFALDSHAQAT